jgi:alkanesulfonate monooxygenase SsuD/methylene tetrahydromethanopterin reductase-like flavin-dependent oxidoreductase (luciferase family)
MVDSRSVGVEVVGDWIGLQPPVHGIAGLARRLEDAGVGYWVIGADRGEAGGTRRGGLDPSLVATVAARHSGGLGLVIAAAGHRDHPYNLARRLVSADHAAGGRVGWLALDFDHRIALNAATDTWTGAVLDARHTADAVAAVRTLCRTWPLQSVVADVAAGIFADIAQIKRADVHQGYAISGPLNLPGSVQYDLPVWQQGPESETAGADLVIVEHGEPLPREQPTVVRVRSLDSIELVLDRIALTSAAGVIFRSAPTQLDRLLDHVLPAARRRGLLAGPGVGTLRERLRLPVPAEPDVSRHEPAFQGAPSAGARL